MKVIFLINVLIPASVLAASGHGEQSETDSMHFYYDPETHYFVAATKSTCFMVPLTRDEQDHVHTTTGIEDLELMMMREWLGKLAETKIYHDDGGLPSNIRRWCATKDIFLLERSIAPIVSSSPATGTVTATVVMATNAGSG